MVKNMKSLTPKKVASAIGVSESSMKRWCDKGLIETIRTNGGHRRLLRPSVIEFIRGQKYRLLDPALIGLPDSISAVEIPLEEASRRLREHLLRADLNGSRSLMLGQYLAGRSFGQLFDQIIAPAFATIGERWECGEIEVYHERRSCEICLTVLREMRELVPEPDATAPCAVGGAPESDPYELPSVMVDLVLKQCGWRTVTLGSRIPMRSFSHAAVEFQPKLVWFSVSHLENPNTFLAEYQAFTAKLPSHVWVVVGGRSLQDQIRKSMTFSSYCDNMQQLERFALKACGGPNLTNPA
jgi:methanogenic corrinoid protein MtbC1